MAQNKKLNIAPIAVTASVTNLLNCNVTAVTGPVGFTMTQPYLLIKHIRAVNTTAGALTLTLYKGATGASAAGTQFMFAGTSIPANSYVDMYTEARFDAVDFLTGIGSATGITLDISAEIGVSG
jgi:hypothetical protein